MEKRRLKAAKLFAAGKGASEVARLLQVRRQSAHDWQQRWREGGVEALRSKGAAGPKHRLSAQEQAALATALVEGPEKHGHATAVWTLPRVAKLIEERTGQRYHPGHVWRLLRGLGFSCQQPTRRAIERDEQAMIVASDWFGSAFFIAQFEGFLASEVSTRRATRPPQIPH